MDTERIRQDRIDQCRYQEGIVPMDAAAAEELARRAGKMAVKREREVVKKALRMVKAAVGTREIRTIATEKMWMQKSVPKRLNVPRQLNQRGLWFPVPGTRVTAFRSREGVETLGGMKGDSLIGTVGHTQWKKGELPRFLIEYEDGSKQWHDVIEEAGTSVRLVEPDEAVTLVTVPVEIRNMLVHGTEIEITWVSPKSKRTEWHRGK